MRGLFNGEFKRWGKLIESAQEVRLRAYAPYSQFFVGAAIETQAGKIFCGCNVENASYGLAICAERSAVCAMVGALGAGTIKRMCVVLSGAGQPGGSPCGACRQVIWEFCGKNPQVEILLVDPEGACRLCTIGELLPDAFSLNS